MNDSAAARKPAPLAALRRHVGVSILVVLLCIGILLTYVIQQPRTYGAEARVAVTGNGLSSDALGAFPLASQELAANYARYVNNAEAQSALEEEMGVPAGVVDRVSASPIPESNVVRIEVRATDEAIAVSAAQRIADSLITLVNDTSTRDADTADALAQYTEFSNQVAAAEQAADAAQLAVDEALGRASSGFPRPGDDIGVLRTSAAEADAQLAILNVQMQALGDRYRSLVTQVTTPANLQVVEPAASTGDDLVVQTSRFGLVGLVIGGGLAAALALFLEARRRRQLGPSSAPTPANESGRSLARSGAGARDSEL